jgi:L-seryl-tRNA(Ser) seleniumtransferase
MPVDVYDELGVDRIINAGGSKTRLSGSIMPNQVVEAMVAASRSLVEIESLQAKASEIIAELTGAEAGLVTTGAAAGLTLAAAACMTGLDVAKMDKLPDTKDMKNEFVIARHQRNAYDHAIRAAGAKLIDAGLDEAGVGVGVRTVEPWEIESALTENSAGIVYFAKPQSKPCLEDLVKIGKEHSVPVIVDAAAELPPATNLRKFVSLGADAVVFSGGKAIRGPQSSGILCGKRDLIAGAALQMLDMDVSFETWNPPSNFIDKSKLIGIPRHGIGRGFKVGKEEIVGLITALRLYAETNQVETNQYERIVINLSQALEKVPGVKATFLPPSKNRLLPCTEIRFTNANHVSDMINIIERLHSNKPPILTDESRMEEMILLVNPFNLTEQDVGIIAQRIKEIMVS